MVVDLAVERDPDALVLIRHRVVTGRRQVDDRKSPMAERHAATTCRPDGCARVVRSAMDHRVTHRHDGLLVRVKTVGEGQDPADATHANRRVAAPPVGLRGPERNP